MGVLSNLSHTDLKVVQAFRIVCCTFCLSSAAILSADSQPWLAMTAKRTMARAKMMTVDFILC